MYNETESTILQRMMGHVSDDLDKREGAVIYDALEPVALEHQELYMDMDASLDARFLMTAPREYLVKMASEDGVTPHAATAAVYSATFTPSGLELAMGERFNCDDLNLYVSGKVSDGVYKLTCETSGEIGNACTGSLIPINYIPGLESATLGSLLVKGVDEEETEAFRKRYHTFRSNPAASGNNADYVNWASSVDGVGAVRVLGAEESGAGKVTVIITNEKRRAADDALCQKVWNYIETVRPIGATVTVESAEEIAVDVTANITLLKGYSLDQCTSAMTEQLTEELAKNAFDVTYVSYAKIGNTLININGIYDYDTLKVNKGTSNITLTDRQVAVPGNVQLEVKS